MKKVSTLTGIAIILVTAIVMLGGAFGYQYYLNQNANIKNQNDNAKIQNETDNWKMYTNERLGFSISIPKEIEIID